MVISGEWVNATNIKDFSLIEKEISSMNVKNRSYFLMEDTNEDYIQIGGFADHFSVEVRLYDVIGKFTHYKADTSQPDTIGDEIVLIGGQNVKVRPSQILSEKIAIDLLRSFFHGEKLSNSVYWKDMTEMFI